MSAEKAASTGFCKESGIPKSREAATPARTTTKKTIRIVPMLSDTAESGRDRIASLSEIPVKEYYYITREDVDDLVFPEEKILFPAGKSAQ
jgi:hypothetical protein